MPKIRSDTPAHVRAFEAHGLILTALPASTQLKGDCPLCGREGKFFVNAESGLWDCKVCGASGNPLTFLRQLCDAGGGSADDYAGLAQDRGLLYPETPQKWGFVRSPVTSEWLVPGYGPDGKVCQLYRYTQIGGRMTLAATPGFGHGLLGLEMFDPSRLDVFIGEGPWDGMALWEMMARVTHHDGGGLSPTSNAEASLLSGANVLAVPACSVFFDGWRPLFAGKRLFFCYDNDHPRRHPKTGAEVEPAAYSATRRACDLLASAAEEDRPAALHFLRWGPQGYDLKRPSGYDVRDVLLVGRTAADRARRLAELFSMLAPVPADWVPGRSAEAKRTGSTETQSLPCRSFRELFDAFRKTMTMHAGLRRALAVMLASVASAPTPGDPLWIKLMSPPSTGKSRLCEALAVARKFVEPLSVVRGFFSGWRGNGSGEDHSLAPRLRDRTLVTKDGDTLLRLPNRDQVLAEARDLYDGTAHTYFKNQTGQNYDDLKFTWILCGTYSLRFLDTSELGERFLSIRIMEKIDDGLEEDIQWRAINQADRSTGGEGPADARHDPARLKAMQMTGGYVEHLRANASCLLAKLSVGEDTKRRLMSLARFVSCMRARPSKTQDEDVSRELSARLTVQFLKLAKHLAVVLNSPTVDGEVMEITHQVALDTSRGRTLDVARFLRKAGREGVEVDRVATFTGETTEKERALLRFLRIIGVAEWWAPQLSPVRKGPPRWRLTDRMTRLWDEVAGPPSYAAGVPAARTGASAVPPPPIKPAPRHLNNGDSNE